ncbi:MAG: patatin-like phospholipase family protein [Chitinophagales bacterium]|nr:patatin-like phospholipase family protein [Chitinophagales bacterium]
MNTINRQEYGLVLSGGGVRGVAHLGLIKALDEQGISPSYISGSSMGAIVGAFYAAGYGYEDILDFLQHTSLFSIQRFSYRKPGLIDTESFYDTFLKYFPDDRFEALEKTLFICATDMVHARSRLFHKGPLIRTILASAAFPGMFSPVVVDERLYADGGIINNFPIEPLLGHCDKIIGCHVNPLKKVSAEELASTTTFLERAYNIGRNSMTEIKFHHCDLLVAPPNLEKYGTFDTSQIDEVFQLGYEATKEALKGLEKE